MAELTQCDPSVTSPPTAEQAAELVAHFGGPTAAARAAGVPRSSLRYWLDPEHQRSRLRAVYAADPEPKRTAVRRHQQNLSGVAWSRRLLKSRRIQALRRRAEREQRRHHRPL